MRAQLILLVAGVAGGLTAGWLTAPRAEAGAPRAAAATPAIAHAGVEAREARERLTRLGFVAPPPIETAPPPPDVAVLFRRDLTAIEERANGRVVWIVDFTQTYRRRALRVGDIYQDGWRVSRIGPQSIDLRRRRDVRTIRVFAPPTMDP
jgi:hypothetical protein